MEEKMKEKRPLKGKKLTKVALTIAFSKLLTPSPYYSHCLVTIGYGFLGYNHPLSRLAYVKRYGEDNILDAEKLADAIMLEPDMTIEKIKDELTQKYR